MDVKIPVKMYRYWPIPISRQFWHPTSTKSWENQAAMHLGSMGSMGSMGASSSTMAPPRRNNETRMGLLDEKKWRDILKVIYGYLVRVSSVYIYKKKKVVHGCTMSPSKHSQKKHFWSHTAILCLCSFRKWSSEFSNPTTILWIIRGFIASEKNWNQWTVRDTPVAKKLCW